MRGDRVDRRDVFHAGPGEGHGSVDLLHRRDGGFHVFGAGASQDVRHLHGKRGGPLRGCRVQDSERDL